MKKIVAVFLIIAVCCMSFDIVGMQSIIGYMAFADEAAVISADNLTLEYTQTIYNGTSQRPEITLKANGIVLKENIDYTVKYPSDTTNIGIKNVQITGVGSYSGNINAAYAIKQLDCSDKESVTVEAENCYYNGLPQYPTVIVKYGDNIIPDSEYTLSLSNNIDVSENSSAVCTLTFKNNCRGKRSINFQVLRAAPEDFEIDITAKAGQSFSMDLSPLLPTGAVFGRLVFGSNEFTAYGQPKIAFNMLTFTLNPQLDTSAMVAVELKDMDNYEDYWLEFYIEIVEKEVPTLYLNPVVTEYNGKPVSAKELAENGSAALVNGTEISGEWSFTTAVPENPCDKTYVVAKFTPDDEQYSYAYGLVPVTVSRRVIEDFKVKAKIRKLHLGDVLTLRIRGIPDDFDGILTVTDKAGEELVFSSYEDEGEQHLEVELPEEEAVYTVRVTLGESAVYASCAEEIKVTVGNPDVEEADIPTTEAELLDMIAKAETASTIRTYKVESISADVLKLAAEKKLIIEVKINDDLSLVLEPAKMASLSQLNLTVNRAVIPPVLLENLGDEELLAFTTFAKSTGGISVKAEIEPDLSYPFVCLYNYGTSGELELLYTVKNSSTTVKFELPISGKFVITASKYSRVKCDVNNDGAFGVADLKAALELYVSISGTPTAEQLMLIDFNGDGMVSVSDLKYLLAYYVSI